MSTISRTGGPPILAEVTAESVASAETKASAAAQRQSPTQAARDAYERRKQGLVAAGQEARYEPPREAQPAADAELLATLAAQSLGAKPELAPAGPLAIAEPALDLAAASAPVFDGAELGAVFSLAAALAGDAASGSTSLGQALGALHEFTVLSTFEPEAAPEVGGQEQQSAGKLAERLLAGTAQQRPSADDLKQMRQELGRALAALDLPAARGIIEAVFGPVSDAVLKRLLLLPPAARVMLGALSKPAKKDTPTGDAMAAAEALPDHAALLKSLASLPRITIPRFDELARAPALDDETLAAVASEIASRPEAARPGFVAAVLQETRRATSDGVSEALVSVETSGDAARAGERLLRVFERALRDGEALLRAEFEQQQPRSVTFEGFSETRSLSLNFGPSGAFPLTVTTPVPEHEFLVGPGRAGAAGEQITLSALRAAAEGWQSEVVALTERSDEAGFALQLALMAQTRASGLLSAALPSAAGEQ